MYAPPPMSQGLVYESCSVRGIYPCSQKHQKIKLKKKSLFWINSKYDQLFVLNYYHYF